MVHRLKLSDKFYEAVRTWKKNFEIRKNDRDFQVGDLVVLEEIDKDGRHTGRGLTRKIMYITSFHQQEGFVVMGMCGPRKKI